MTRRNRRPAAPTEDLHRLLGLTTPPAPELVDAGPTREHVARLRAAGWGSRTIADRSGVGRRAIRALTVGRSSGDAPTRRVLPETEARILEIDPAEPKPSCLTAS